MQKNEGTIDRIIRAVLGIVILYLAYAGTGGIFGYIVGIILLITAVTGFCGVYKLFGISTKK